MEHPLHLPPGEVVWPRRWSHWDERLVLPPRGGPRPCLEGGPIGDAVEPAPQRRRLADRAGLAGENEERGLEGVLGVGLVAEYTAADLQHHRPVPAQHGTESGLILVDMEPAEQLPIRQLPHPRVLHELADEV